MNRDALAVRLLGLFLTELEDQLRTLNSDLLALETDPLDNERLGSVFRIVHTLKGAAHAAGVPEAENVCHALEVLLSRARDRQLVLGPGDFARLFAAADALEEAATRLKAGRDLAESPLAALQRDPAGGAAGESRPAVTSPGAGRVFPSRPTPSPDSSPNPSRSPDSEAAAATVASETAAGPAPLPPEPGRDQVRVEAEKLDALLASAGELRVAAGRVATRRGELDTLSEVASGWTAEWRRSARGLRLLARKEERAGPLLEAIDEVEKHLRWIGEESGRIAAGAAADSRALSHTVGEVGNGVHRLRLRPFSDACVALPRAVRDLGTASGKDVRLEILGGEVEADREVLDVLGDVLLHLVRNAVDHGIELPAERLEAGKPGVATVTVAAALDRQRLQVKVADDGRGLDVASIRAELTGRGLEVPEEMDALVDQIFKPGFSTRNEPTKVSGRGVGLDVVRTTIERIRGSVIVTWTEGEGTEFTLECPPSLATMRALLVATGEQIFAIPSAYVERLLLVRKEEIRRAGGRAVILTADSPVPVASLTRLLGPPLPDEPPDDPFPVVRLQVGERRFAVAVDRLLGEEEIVVRPVERLRNPPAYLGGAALLGTGRVALVLNAASLIATGLEGTASGIRAGEGDSAEAVRRRILIVDDSITTRALEQSILEAEGFEVRTAIDGAEGWQRLQEESFDLVVADVEMPRMTGFELCKAIRGSKRLAELPIILVTALEAAEHRELGLEAGADAYLPKSSFDQQHLIDTIKQLLG